jgi:enoyl-CoA hydratase
MDYSAYSFLRVDVREGIAYITMNRPDKANACRAEEHGEFSAILRDLGRDDDVKVALLHGSGPHFSVGADWEFLDQLVSDKQVLLELQEQARDLVLNHAALDKPVVAALHGTATGSGLMFALLSDVIVASRTAKLADGHVKIALAAGDGGCLIWPLAVGITRAKRYLLTGDFIGAVEAERIGLITEVVEPGAEFDRAEEYAKQLRDAPQAAVRYTKRALNQWLRLGAQISFELSLALEIETFSATSDAVRAAVAALKGELAAARTSPR